MTNIHNNQLTDKTESSQIDTEYEQMSELNTNLVSEEDNIEKTISYDETISEQKDELKESDKTEPVIEDSNRNLFKEDWDSESDYDEKKIQTDQDENEKIETLDQQQEEEDEEERTEVENEDGLVPPVKLVISKKKGSIFKSRSLVTDGTKKRRALYRHKWCDDKDGGQKANDDAVQRNKESAAVYDEFGFSDEPLQRVTNLRPSTDEGDGVTSIKCTKADKGVSFL